MKANIFNKQFTLPDLQEYASQLREDNKKVVTPQAEDIYEKCLSMIEIVRAQLQPRKLWPERVRFFPFNFTFVQRSCLRLYNFIFKEQQRTAAHLLEIIQQLNYALLISQSDQKRALQYFKAEQKMWQEDIPHLKNNLLKQISELSSHNPIVPKKDSDSEMTLDQLYAGFEACFRGTNEEIKYRQRKYLPYIKNVLGLFPEPRVVDLACGRGEWLELLKEESICALGIDLNSVFIQDCRQRELMVIQQDILEYLNNLENNSVIAVTAFHIIEHLPFETLIKFFEEIMRVLKPGGVIIVETPNPENVLVGSYSFYLDPTHRNPIPAKVTEFLLKSKGFVNSKILYLSEQPDEVKFKGKSEVEKRLNSLFYGAQDYGIVAYKGDVETT